MSLHFALAPLILALAACGPSGEKTAEQPAAQNEGEAVAPAAPANAVATAGATPPAAFGICATCHSTEPGKVGIGPSLAGVVGRTAGATDYNYSPAMKASGVHWDAATLDAYIASPHSIVPGTKMSYAGLKDAKKRAAIVEYLETLK